MKYTMKELEDIIKRPPQTIRRILRNNPQLAQYKEVKPNKNVLFGEEILAFLKAYFEITEDSTCKNDPVVENGVGIGENKTENGDNPQTNPPLTTHNEASAGIEDELRATIEALEAELEAKERELAGKDADLKANAAAFEGKKAEVEGLTQARDSLTEANAALQAKYETLEARILDLEGRIQAQAADIESKREQIERLIVSNNALSITVNRAQQERLLAEAKKPNLLQRIKNRLLGQKPVIVAEGTPEAAVVETENAEEQ